MHRVTCYCLNGSNISADAVARVIRTTRTYRGPGPVARAFLRVQNALARAG